MRDVDIERSRVVSGRPGETRRRRKLGPDATLCGLARPLSTRSRVFSGPSRSRTLRTGADGPSSCPRLATVRPATGSDRWAATASSASRIASPASAARPSTSPVERISGPSSIADARQPPERADRCLDRDERAVGGEARRRSPTSASDRAERTAHRRGHDVEAGGLGDDRHRAAGARIGLDDHHAISRHDHLHVEDAAHPERERDPAGRLGGALLGVARESLRREHRDAVAGVDARAGRPARGCPGTDHRSPSLMTSTSSSTPATSSSTRSGQPTSVREVVGDVSLRAQHRDPASADHPRGTHDDGQPAERVDRGRAARGADPASLPARPVEPELVEQARRSARDPR